MVGITPDVHYYMTHQRKDTTRLFNSYWTFMRRWMHSTRTETLRCIGQRPMETSRLPGYCFGITRRSTLGTTRDLPRYIKHRMETRAPWYSCCWITMRMHARATRMETLLCIYQRPMATSRPPGCCLSTTPKSMLGTTRGLPRYTTRRMESRVP